MKQPKVFPLVVVISLFERCGFYTLAFLMVLYTRSQFLMSDHDSYILYGTLNALLFLTPAAGGWLADNVIGIKRAAILGIFLEALGLTLVSFPDIDLFLLGLALLVIGVGFFRTTPSDLLGRAYKKNDTRIDNGFTILYMIANIGAFIAPIIAGFLQYEFGWQIAFLFGAAIMYANLLLYFLLRHDAKDVGVAIGKKGLSFSTFINILLGIIAAIVICILLLHFTTIAHLFFFLTGGLLLLYFAYEITKSPKREKLKIIACLSLIAIGMVFYVMFFQYFMSITLFIDRCLRHAVLGINIPTASFLSLDALWIIILSPFMVYIYNLIRRKRGRDLLITTKFPIGLLLISLCFIILKIGTNFHDANFQIASWWIIFAIPFYAIGELLIAALGVAMVTHIAPKRLYGVMMGAWYLIAAALASSIASMVANIASIPETIHSQAITLSTYGNTFLEIGIAGLIAAAVAFIISPYIKKIAYS